MTINMTDYAVAKRAGDMRVIHANASSRKAVSAASIIGGIILAAVALGCTALLGKLAIAAGGAL